MGAIAEEAASQLREEGVALLRNAFPKTWLMLLQESAAHCFEAIRSKRPLPDRYRFNRSSHSVLITALEDFGCGMDEILRPLSAPGLDRLFAKAMGGEWTCGLEQSWVRKKFNPLKAPDPQYHPQDWHQDGALGVQFTLERGPAVPIVRLLTCWIPLTPCGTDSPGLEFVRRREPELLHFTELDDATLRGRFPAHQFWAPALEFGDGLVFLNGTLHRTFAHSGMRHSRLSVEYRIFPR